MKNVLKPTKISCSLLTESFIIFSGRSSVTRFCSDIRKGNVYLDEFWHRCLQEQSLKSKKIQKWIHNKHHWGERDLVQLNRTIQYGERQLEN